MKHEPLVLTVVVNWNGAADSIRCCESVLALDYRATRVVVVDNGSEAADLAQLTTWVTKQNPDRVTLLTNLANGGFAAGVNRAIDFATTMEPMPWIWLLNNDAVASVDALTHLVDRTRADPAIGMCGSTILLSTQPHRVQTLGGGTYNRWLGVSHHIEPLSSFPRAIDRDAVEQRMAYVSGASLLARPEFVRDVGPMDERFFLYSEELDWARRGAGHGYRLGYAPDSIVSHREGASIGTSSEPGKRSARSEYYLFRSELLFTKKHAPRWLLATRVGLLLRLLRRIRRRQWSLVRVAARLLIGLDMHPDHHPVDPKTLGRAAVT